MVVDAGDAITLNAVASLSPVAGVQATLPIGTEAGLGTVVNVVVPNKQMVSSAIGAKSMAGTTSTSTLSSPQADVMV